MVPVFLPSPACIPENQISLSVPWPQALSQRELGLLEWLGEGPWPEGWIRPGGQARLDCRTFMKRQLCSGSCPVAVW